MEDQLHRPAAINKITAPEKKSAALHVHGGESGMKVSHVAPEVMVTATPKSSSSHRRRHPKQQQHHLLVPSPRACLCSPTTHAGSFRCRLHRGGSVGSGLHEMGDKKQPGA